MNLQVLFRLSPQSHVWNFFLRDALKNVYYVIFVMMKKWEQPNCSSIYRDKMVEYIVRLHTQKYSIEEICVHRQMSLSLC